MYNEPELREIKADIDRNDLSSASHKCLGFLRENPTNVSAMELYAEIAIRKRRLEEAMLIYQKLLAVAPRNIVAHQELSSLYKDLGDFYHAMGHAKAALDVDPTLVEPYLILGSIAIIQGREKEGAREFAQAHRCSADKLSVGLPHAEALMTAGRFEEASRIFRDLIALYPDEISCYAGLSTSVRFETGHEDESLIRSLLDEHGELRKAFGASPETTASAYMTLFKLESDIGNSELAFRYLQNAKQIFKAGEQFDIGKTRTIFSTNQKVFNAQFVQSHQDVGCDADDPIFVVGMPRSGTTLLERVLSSEENIAAGDELPIISRLTAEVSARHGANQHDLASLSSLPTAEWRELGEEYIRRARAQVPSGKHFVDKNPGNAYMLGFIKTILPKARIIHSVRHPVATCLSIYEQNFAHAHVYSNDLEWLGQIYLLYRDYMDYWHELYPGDIIEVAYEDLVSDEDKVATEVFSKLGLEGKRDMQESQATGNIRTASLWQARQPIHTQSVARWKKYRQQLAPLLEVLAPILSAEDLK